MFSTLVANRICRLIGLNCGRRVHKKVEHDKGKYVFKKVSPGSKDCIKELKLE